MLPVSPVTLHSTANLLRALPNHIAAGPVARPTRRRAGFTIIELAIAIAVLVIAAGALTTSFVATTSLGRMSRAQALAADAAQSAMEAMRGENFSEIFARFNADPGDDPVFGASPGNTFTVRGLDPQAADPDGIVGLILMPVNGLQLREDVVDAALGMPRDLNDDALIDALDHAGNYTMLPVRVRVEWTGSAGDLAIEFITVLADL